MINEKLVRNIEEHGTFRSNWQSKEAILRDIGFSFGKKADYAIIMGCVQPEMMPDVIKSLKKLLDRLGISYTLLAKEYCCGWLAFGQKAVMDKDDEDINRSKELSRRFIRGNFEQAEALGVKAIVLFCGACEPSYTNMAAETKLPVISYSDLIAEYFHKGKLDMELDYYPGCYRFRRRITDKPVDIEAAKRLLGKVAGIKVNEPDSNLCCYIPPHMDKLTQSFASKNIVTICTGCYHNLRRNLKEKNEYRVWMLPEILLQALPE
ncbi:MAG TPA: (Fe-S)-binding protein [Smithellaceae bacterium]|nr:(Fe-S)-binding protein [Smithellaceae bacterium]